VTESLDANSGRYGTVGNHNFQPLDRQLLEKADELSFPAHDARLFRQAQRRFQQPVGHDLLYGVSDPHPELSRPPSRGVVQNAFQLLAQGEDLVSVAQYHSSRVGKVKAAPDAGKQLVTQHVFERTYLSADRLRSQMQALAGAGDSASLGDHPEIVQMLVVQRSHEPTTLRVCRTDSIFLSCSSTNSVGDLSSNYTNRFYMLFEHIRRYIRFF